MRRHTRLFAASIGFVAVAGVLSSCSVNPVTGKRQIMLMSESQEIALGRDSDEAIVAQYGLVDDPALAAYVSEIGQRIVPVSHRPDLTFTFRLLDDPVVNAFALPGGFVYITRGILGYLDSEAALAGVMGHEVGHVTARHSAERYTKQQLLGLGIGIGSVISQDFAEYAGLAGTAAQLLLLKYGRDDERQADRLGVEYATKLKYDTVDMADFFGTLDALSGGSARLPDWQSTHPDPGERFETVKALTAEWKTQVGGGTFSTGRDAYLTRLDGLAFGPNPREGFVEAGTFHHPDLAFSFPVPAGWGVANGKTEVQLGEPNGAAGMIFTLAAEKSAADAASAFSQTSGIQIASRQAVRAGDYSGVRLTGTAATQSGSIALSSTFVDKDGAVYVFHGLTSTGSFTTYEPTFRSVTDGFRRLTDPALLGVQPVRIHVVRAPRTATFRDLVAGEPIPKRAGIDVEGLALVNGVSADDVIPTGTLLKVLR